MTEREVCTVEYHIVLTIVSKWFEISCDHTWSDHMWFLGHVLFIILLFYFWDIIYHVFLIVKFTWRMFLQFPFFVFIKTWLEISYKNSKISHVKKTTSVISVLTRSLGSHHTAFMDRLSTYQRAPLYWTR